MTLVDKIRHLANQRSLSLPQLETELGFGGGTISRWKTASPGSDKLQKVADYFNVSTDYLLGRDNFLTPKDERDIARDLERMMQGIKDGKDGPLYYDGKEIDSTSLTLLENAIESAMKTMKIINKEKYDPRKNKK